MTGLQVFATGYIRRSFGKADDTLRDIDVGSFMDAAEKAFPSGFRSLVIARFLLATVGSIMVITLMATSSATEYFR